MTILLGVIAYLLGLYFLRNNIVFLLILSVAFFIFSFVRVGWKKSLDFLFIFGGGIAISNIPFQYNSPSDEYAGVVIEAHDNYFLFQSGIERFYVYEKDSQREIGDFLTISDKNPTEIAFTTYESQFDFANYLHDKRVNRELSGSIRSDFESPFRTRAIADKFIDQFDEETGFLIDAFLFNNKSNESSALNSAGNLNILFLFASSGIYLSFLLRCTKKLFGLVLDDKLADIFALAIWSPYLIFAFPRLGLLRVVFVYVFRYFNNYFFKKKLTSLNVLAISMACFLAFDYSFAYQAGFYVGFSLSLIFLFLSHSLTRYKKRYRQPIIWLVMLLFVLPLSSFGGSGWHVFGMLYQIAATPINEGFVLISIISFYITPFPHVLSGYSWVTHEMLNVFQIIDVVLYLGDYGYLFSAVYYILLIFGFYLFESQRWRHLAICSATISSLIIFALLPIKTFLFDGIYFINVGQGDSILIQSGYHAVMIDTGGNLNFDMAEETLIPFMHKRQIYQLDALITTHDDFDHAGAASSLIEKFDVKDYFTKVDEFPYQIGGIHLENLNIYSGKDENDSSLVLSLDFIGKKWLFMGDASSEIEKFLIDDNPELDCDILKIGHHGSKTSTCEEFVRAVTPDVAIISVGKKNSYHHPSDEVLEILSDNDVEVRRTDEEGTISFVVLHNAKLLF